MCFGRKLRARSQREPAELFSIWLPSSRRAHSAVCPALRPTCSSAPPNRPGPHAGCTSCRNTRAQKHGAAQSKSFRLHRSQCLNCSRHPCMFHTRSVIALFSSLVLRLSSACHTVCNKERSLLDPCTLRYGIINLVQLCFLSPLDFSGCFHSSPVLFRTASSPLVSFQSNRNRVGLSTQKKKKKHFTSGTTCLYPPQFRTSLHQSRAYPFTIGLVLGSTFQLRHLPCYSHVLVQT